MKKLIYVFALGALIIVSSCKKEDDPPTTTTTTTTTQSEPRTCYNYNYMNPNDPVEYTGTRCWTEAEALSAKQLYGYYNFVDKGKNWCNCQ